MKIHLLSQVPSLFSGVDERPGKFETESYVVGATAPFPVSDSWQGVGGSSSLMVSYSRGQRTPALVAVIAGTRFNGTLAAGSGDRMRDRSTRDCVDESGFPTPCNRHNETKLKSIISLRLLFLLEWVSRRELWENSELQSRDHIIALFQWHSITLARKKNPSESLFLLKLPALQF